ncbi:type 1 glutamine amidotransferase domain-containing protein [Paracidovorax citrulli]|uniref:Intracellular protease, PfpI family n=2 Tax=Paracidovorax citrulli TaxID=80869 RepID=A1TMJ4_PARC0|nr:type 1 glutamine amidotransferase domain-containing protein [Paracidovorax citrulli]ABM32182.1 intracellular protease, PfpI family [Paracidovorax citrulli AAC00-1]PVY66372.1 protease I [Paracidovorax citrulli]QCX12102.1 Putative cysteine protease YraA [Paracidovorax citrulli]REG69457.1 protease I [Paracidovorax citrulli]RLJ94011.1 protease I [Paracidovorax citrulli]
MASSSNGTSASSSMARGRRIALLVTDGFEQAELTGPRDALEGAGFDAQIVAPKPGQVQGFNHVDKADRFDVDQTLDQASPDAFDAVVLPGGVVNADELRTDEKARAFVQAIDRAGKPVAVICHGAWLLIDAGLVKGKTLTSWPSLATDLRNAGAQWVDRPVQVEGRWISSRKPDDIPQFNEQILKTLQQGAGTEREARS